MNCEGETMGALLPSAGVLLADLIISELITWPSEVTSSCELRDSATARLAPMLDVMLVVTERLVVFSVQLFLRKILFSVAR